MRDEIEVGETGSFTWGGHDLLGIVREVYGPPTSRQVVLTLTPELTGEVVDTPTTLSLPIERVRKAPAAA